MIDSTGKLQVLYSPDFDPLDIEVPPADGSQAPNFFDLFDDEPSPTDSKTDLRVKQFTKITVLQEEAKPYFKDPDFYKVILSGEGEISKKVHQVLQDFLKATDSQDKSLHRGRFIPAYWELFSNVASKIGTKMPDPKMLLLRYGVLLPTAIEADQRQLIATVPHKNETGEPIYYLDEWLKEVALGRVSASATDETKGARVSEQGKLNSLIDKARGRLDAQRQVVANISTDMISLERVMLEHVQNISRHQYLGQYNNCQQPYDEGQKTSLTEISELTKNLILQNRKLQQAVAELESLEMQLTDLRSRVDENADDTSIDTKAISEEINTVKQMVKMCIGRQGNHFPMLMKAYFRGNIRDLGSRENVINYLADIEYLDSGLFQRTFKQQTNRIVPNIILSPCYGDYGVCWEPFERHNRSTSRGRIVIPMYPKDLRIAVVAAAADLRWQVAKEKAQHYWMEEGLTGWYYQWFSDKKMKGDVKDQFIEDYILWITKECDGTQKLDREVRDIFWRYMPFPQELKDKLKNRGFVYAELAKKDNNRAMSDGY